MEDDVQVLVGPYPRQIGAEVVLVGDVIYRAQVAGRGQDGSLKERNHNDEYGAGHDGIYPA